MHALYSQEEDAKIIRKFPNPLPPQKPYRFFAPPLQTASSTNRQRSRRRPHTPVDAFGHYLEIRDSLRCLRGWGHRDSPAMCRHSRIRANKAVDCAFQGTSRISWRRHSNTEPPKERIRGPGRCDSAVGEGRGTATGPVEVVVVISLLSSAPIPSNSPP